MDVIISDKEIKINYKVMENIKEQDVVMEHGNVLFISINNLI